MSGNLLPVPKELTVSQADGIHLGMTVGNEQLASAMDNERFTSARDYLLKQTLFSEETVGETTGYVLGLAAIGNRRNPELRKADLNNVSEFLGTLLWNPFINYEVDEQTKIAVDLGPYYAFGGSDRLGMAANVRWPRAPDNDVAKRATDIMQEAASNLKYAHDLARKYGYKDMVYAYVSRQNGVVLETNPMGSCSIGTDGFDFRPEEPVFELHSHNLYAVEQQLVCLTGALAIAHADTLLQ
jgi:hypothetical protein